jgi:hypothetical protein
MLTPSSLQTGSRDSSFRSHPYLRGAWEVTLVIVSIIMALVLSIATSTSSASGAVAGKGDRLPVNPASSAPTLRIQELTAGCDSLASPLARSPLAHVPGRCLA